MAAQGGLELSGHGRALREVVSMGSRNPAPLGAKGARGSPSQSHGDPAKKGNLLTGILLTGPLRATGILLTGILLKLDHAKKGILLTGILLKREPCHRATRGHGDPAKNGILLTGVLLTGILLIGTLLTGILLKKGPC